jgi:hypothetical protein
MKLTSFNTLIVTKNAEEVAKLFEELGFERRHHGHAVNSDGREVGGIRMKDANGFYVDVAQNDAVERDLTMIRMNVDDFDEAYDMLTAKGFTNPKSEVDTKSNRNAALISPSGFQFHLCHHIKNHD